MTTPHPLPTSSLHHDTDAHLPAAAYLRYESRADGWSPGRQAAFLAHLADHGVVADAAKCVGMSLGGGYALRRQARGFAFGLGWEAALLLARRIVADRLMAAAIQGEEARWVREDGVTTYTRQNTRLSLALLDQVTPAATLPEVTAVMHRFDWFLELIEKAASAQQMWDLFFDDALTRDDAQARARVRGRFYFVRKLRVLRRRWSRRKAQTAIASMMIMRACMRTRKKARRRRTSRRWTWTKQPNPPSNINRWMGRHYFTLSRRERIWSLGRAAA